MLRVYSFETIRGPLYFPYFHKNARSSKYANRSYTLFLTDYVHSLNMVVNSRSVWPTFRDSAVGIATRYWLDGPGIECWWGGPGAHPASYTMGNGYFPGVKRPERGVDHPPPPSAEVHLGLRGLS